MRSDEWEHQNVGTDIECWERTNHDGSTTTVYRVDRDGDVEVNVDRIYGLDSKSAFVPRHILEAAMKPLEEERS